MFPLTKHIFTLVICNQSCPQAGKHRADLILANAGKQLCPFQYRNKFFHGAKLLIAADCTAYAYANMHEEFMKGRITVIGCPKLDAVDYTEKLTAIIRDNEIKNVTIVRMEVPCCGGLQRAAENALQASGKFIPWQVVTISTDGHILD